MNNNETKRMTKLTPKEMNEITGGESVFYWIAYGISYAARVYYEEQLEITEAVGNGRK